MFSANSHNHRNYIMLNIHFFAHRRVQIVSFLSLVVLLVQRDLRVRYRGSFLGYLWSMLNPLLYMLILTFIFKHLIRFQIPHYGLYILSGIMTWNLFQQSLSTGVHSIVNNAGLLRKVKVHALLFPAANVCSVAVNFSLALFPYVIVAWFSGVKLSFWLFALPIAIIPYMMFIFGVTLIAATFNVFFRDVGHTMEPVLILIFYGSPVIYQITNLPERYQKLAYFNPLAHYLEYIRSFIFTGEAPSAWEMLAACGFGVASMFIGLFIYRCFRDRIIFKL